MNYGTFSCNDSILELENEDENNENITPRLIRSVIHTTALLLVVLIAFIEGELLMPAITGSVVAVLYFIWKVIKPQWIKQGTCPLSTNNNSIVQHSWLVSSKPPKLARHLL